MGARYATKRLYQLWDQPSLLFSVYPRLDPCVKLTIRQYNLPRLRSEWSLTSAPRMFRHRVGKD